MKSEYPNQDSPWIGFHMEEADLLFVTQGRKPRSYDKGEILVQLFQKTRQIYIIESGSIQILSNSIDGDIKTVMLAGPGNTLGEISAILDRPISVSAIAQEDSQVFVIPAAEFKARLEENPELLWRFVSQMALKSHILMSQIQMLSFNKPRDRVLRTLHWIFNQFGIPYENGLAIDNRPQNPERLSHQDIAEITALSRVSVSNVFSALYEEGILKRRNGYLWIDSLESLE